MAGEHDRSPAGLVPFWAHQLAEMLLGGLLLVEGARTGEHTAVLVGMGSLLLLLALMSDGALGAWPWIGRRLHRVLDLVAAAALAISPLVLSLDAVLPVVILEVAALGMLWLALRTNWTVRARRSARTRPATPPAAPPAAPPAPAPAPTPGSPAPSSSAPPSPAPPLARKLGTVAGKARDDGPRQLGRAVGRIRRAARGSGGPAAPPPATDPSPGAPPDAPPPADAG
jgi:pyruvate/2-oxoglutarate dehydrogenase complex dihydrolipoamide acyltransferase (E2) component